MSSVDPTLKHIGNVLEKSASELARGINHVLAICIDEYHHHSRYPHPELWLLHG